MAELKHGSHECLLISPEIVVDGICNMCYKDEPVEFACNPCNFDLCKACSKIPQKVSHDFHPEHPLEFCVSKDDGKSLDMLCSGCGNLFTEPFYYKCKKCEIYLELGCGVLKNIANGWNAEEMLQYSHAHLIRRCRPGRNVKGFCLLCELPLSPSAICYGCFQCYSFVHERCLDFLRKIQHHVHLAHPLIRLDFTHTCGSGKLCDACGLYIDGAPFGCLECGFDLHMRCADYLLRDPPSLNCFSYMLQLTDIWHNHMMTLGDVKDILRVVCNICDGDILGRPWECKTCIFMAHDYCIELRKPSRHRFHVNHLLTLLPSYPAGFIMNCYTCKTKIENFNLFCRVCNFIICTKCMVRAKQVLGELHRGQKFIGLTTEGTCFRRMHDLVEVMVSRSYATACTICVERLCGKVLTCVTCKDIYHPRCIQLRRQERRGHPLHSDHSLEIKLTSGSKCIACKLSIKRYGYNCSTCKVSFHIECIEAVSISGKIKSHKHYLYNFWMDDSRLNRACSICGKPCGASFYGCIGCNDFSAHVGCIGFPANVKNQQHQHIVVQSYSWCRMSCSLCGLDIETSEKFRYSCNHCEDVFHMECIMSMDEREAATEEEQIKDIYLMYIERDLFSLLKDALYQHTNSDDEGSAF
ncbi:hypothetical protein ARALYDRAFT_343769 [Arabidopsis lyrata subsp. lyrata]|uniref:Phorbol-ester/DAG-type domain-containing protein n=1 Tax=Arabidopsis lyrata subsp. lyrata TaxID=81972 RepID=D7LDB0_ARALL|nr:hypothetical protein ARALYDRAFT_343769 [Arabidopsis lyrata subsp. lyrata]